MTGNDMTGNGKCGAATALDDVFDGFDSTGVSWALLRGRSTLDLAGRDVDLLVAGADLARAEEVIFALGGVALPRALHPWHRFYVIGDRRSRHGLKLDIVVELIYHRELRFRSGLEGPLLERRVHDGRVHVLDPTDLFWTVLLHCLLDKQAVNDRRRAELAAAAPVVVTPSPGQEFFESLCPPEWTGDRAVERARAGDWPSLVALGRAMLARAGAASPSSAHVDPAPRAKGMSRLPAATVQKPRQWARSMAAAAYPVVWRRAGLGASPRVLRVVEETAVDVLVLGLRRRPALCEVDLLVDDGLHERLVCALRQARYRWAAGAWNRLTRAGLERVCVTSPSQREMTAATWAELSTSSSPMYRRRHCRRPGKEQSSSSARSKHTADEWAVRTKRGT
ncbi:hypothetical protein [Micromonospora sp. IBHARD004]|uniref:hypothetical protein n=1 Tax=Micromonospora sp. IBHARD004 TaxID=3457764 RepID=UPI004058F1EB